MARCVKTMIILYSILVNSVGKEFHREGPRTKTDNFLILVRA